MLAKLWPSKKDGDADADMLDNKAPAKPMPKSSFTMAALERRMSQSGADLRIEKDEAEILDAVTFFVKTMNDQDGVALHLHDMNLFYGDRALLTITIAMDGVQKKMKKRELYCLVQDGDIYVQFEGRRNAMGDKVFLPTAKPKHFYNFSDAQGREEFLEKIAAEFAEFKFMQRYGSRRVGYVYQRLAEQKRR